MTANLRNPGCELNDELSRTPDKLHFRIHAHLRCSACKEHKPLKGGKRPKDAYGNQIFICKECGSC